MTDPRPRRQRWCTLIDPDEVARRAAEEDLVPVKWSEDLTDRLYVLGIDVVDGAVIEEATVTEKAARAGGDPEMLLRRTLDAYDDRIEVEYDMVRQTYSTHRRVVRAHVPVWCELVVRALDVGLGVRYPRAPRRHHPDTSAIPLVARATNSNFLLDRLLMRLLHDREEAAAVVASYALGGDVAAKARIHALVVDEVGDEAARLLGIE